MAGISYIGPAVSIHGLSCNKEVSVSATRNANVKVLTCDKTISISAQNIILIQTSGEHIDLSGKRADIDSCSTTRSFQVKANSLRLSSSILQESVIIDSPKSLITRSLLNHALIRGKKLTCAFTSFSETTLISDTDGKFLSSPLQGNAVFINSRLTFYESDITGPVDCTNSCVTSVSSDGNIATFSDSFLTAVDSNWTVTGGAASVLVGIGSDITADGYVFSAAVLDGSLIVSGDAPSAVLSVGTDLTGNYQGVVAVGGTLDISPVALVVVGASGQVQQNTGVDSTVVLGGTLGGSVEGSSLVAASSGPDVSGAAVVLGAGQPTSGSYVWLDGVGSASIGNSDYAYIDLDQTTLQIATDGESWLSWDPSSLSPRIWNGIPFTLS